MSRRSSSLPWLLAGALLLALPVRAQAPAAPAAPAEKRELIYCADRMTPEAREAYRAKMRAARTVQEKEALRAAHRAEMHAPFGERGSVECEPPGRQWRGGRQP